MSCHPRLVIAVNFDLLAGPDCTVDPPYGDIHIAQPRGSVQVRQGRLQEPLRKSRCFATASDQ